MGEGSPQFRDTQTHPDSAPASVRGAAGNQVKGDCVLLSVGPGQHDPAVHQVSRTLEGREWPGEQASWEEREEAKLRTPKQNFTDPSILGEGYQLPCTQVSGQGVTQPELELGSSGPHHWPTSHKLPAVLL